MAATDDVASWVWASSWGNKSMSPFQADVVGTGEYLIVDGTQKRDVSELLDLLALADTPFINAVGWGAESGGTCIEWISEDLGPGYITNKSITASGAMISLLIGTVDGVESTDLARQLHEGTLMYVYLSEDTRQAIAVVTSEVVVGDQYATVHLSALSLDVYVSQIGSADADTKWYVLGNVVNEGSIPGYAHPRSRVVCTNTFSILRQDVAITGSMRETDMYVIGREDRHQILMRMKEMQRERERMALYSVYSAKTSLAAGLLNGVFGFLTTQSGAHIDRSTKALTESAVNTVVTKIWENGGRNLSWFSHIDQTAKFTRWDKNRIRMRVNEGRGGGHITSYLTEAGIELDLHPMGNTPTNLAFVLDTSRIRLRAKKNRKAILEKLGKVGDSDNWQLLTEFSLEMQGYNLRQHGMLACLV